MRSADVTIPPLSTREGIVDCSPGKKPLGGGYFGPIVNTLNNHPTASGWRVSMENKYPLTTAYSSVYVICADVA